MIKQSKTSKNINVYKYGKMKLKKLLIYMLLKENGKNLGNPTNHKQVCFPKKKDSQHYEDKF